MVIESRSSMFCFLTYLSNHSGTLVFTAWKLSSFSLLLSRLNLQPLHSGIYTTLKCNLLHLFNARVYLRKVVRKGLSEQALLRWGLRPSHVARSSREDASRTGVELHQELPLLTWRLPKLLLSRSSQLLLTPPVEAPGHLVTMSTVPSPVKGHPSCQPRVYGLTGDSSVPSLTFSLYSIETT